VCFLSKTFNHDAQHAKLQSTPGPKKKKEKGKKKILKKRKQKNEKEGHETWETEPD
jgi:hypothetical protein